MGKGAITMPSVSLIDGHIDGIKPCETCIYYDNDRADTPCCSCVSGGNWESEVTDNDR